MSIGITSQEFRLFKEFIHERTGILLGDDKAYLVEHRLASLLREYDCKSYGDLYLKARESQSWGALSLAIVDSMTTKETSWFRDPKHFNYLRQTLLPAMYEEIRQGQRSEIRIWSAASSTGQEPFSIAMTALDFYSKRGGGQACQEQVKILGTDISTSSLEVCQKATYDNVSVSRGLLPGFLERYFQERGAKWSLVRKVRDLVEFKQFNLRDPLVNLGRFDIVFLRNVIIYFSDEFKRDLLGRIASSFLPGGYLFLGTGETLGHYTEAFEPVACNGPVVYRLKSKS